MVLTASQLRERASRQVLYVDVPAPAFLGGDGETVRIWKPAGESILELVNAGPSEDATQSDQIRYGILILSKTLGDESGELVFDSDAGRELLDRETLALGGLIKAAGEFLGLSDGDDSGN